MIERGAQPGIDKKIEPGRGSNAYQVDTNHKPGISRRNFIKFMGAAAAVTLGELDLSQIVGAQEIRTSGRHGLEMFALGEREAEVYDSFNEGLVPIVITKTNDDSQLEITVPIDLQTSYVYKEDGSLSIINTKTGETESVDSSEFSDAVGQQISVVKIWNQDNNWVRLEDLETSLLVNRGRAGMIIKTKRGLNMGGE